MRITSQRWWNNRHGSISQNSGVKIILNQVLSSWTVGDHEHVVGLGPGKEYVHEFLLIPGSAFNRSMVVLSQNRGMKLILIKSATGR